MNVKEAIICTNTASGTRSGLTAADGVNSLIMNITLFMWLLIHVSCGAADAGPTQRGVMMKSIKTEAAGQSQELQELGNIFSYIRSILEHITYKHI